MGFSVTPKWGNLLLGELLGRGLPLPLTGPGMGYGVEGAGCKDLASEKIESKKSVKQKMWEPAARPAAELRPPAAARAPSSPQPPLAGVGSPNT